MGKETARVPSAETAVTSISLVGAQLKKNWELSEFDTCVMRSWESREKY
jgi:hypothetical protein